MDEERQVIAPSKLYLGSALDAEGLRRIEQTLHLQYHKWDTQVGDVRTLSEQPLILAADEWGRLCHTAERLAAETLEIESIIVERPGWEQLLGVPRKAGNIVIKSSKGSRQVPRSMRFDFHPTADGWRVSEVNSDVPGGWTEGTVLPPLYRRAYPDFECPPSPLDSWGESVESLNPNGSVALLSAPGFLEDEQVVRGFARQLELRNIPCAMIQAPSALTWSEGICKLAMSGHRIGAIVRFYQAEWLCSFPRRTGWSDVLSTSSIPILNPAASMLSESKRFPLALNRLSGFETWRMVSPECRDPRDIDPWNCDDWVLKAAYSNTGDNVYILANMTAERRRELLRSALRSP